MVYPTSASMSSTNASTSMHRAADLYTIQSTLILGSDSQGNEWLALVRRLTIL